MNFIDIFTNLGIIETTIGMLVGLIFRDFIYSIADEFVLPLLLVLLNIKSLESFKYTYKAHPFNIGIIISNFIRTILIVVIVVCLLVYVIGPITKKIIDDKKDTHNQIVKELQDIQTNTKKMDKDINELKDNVKKQNTPDSFFGKLI